MNKQTVQIKQMEHAIQSQIIYKEYCYNQSLIFADSPETLEYFQSYQSKYRHAQTKLEGMLDIYAIITNRNTTNIQQQINQKQEWRQSQ